MNLQQFCFPVDERDVLFLSHSKFFDWKTKSYVLKPTDKPADQYKAIVWSNTSFLNYGFETQVPYISLSDRLSNH